MRYYTTNVVYAGDQTEVVHLNLIEHEKNCSISKPQTLTNVIYSS